MILKTEDFKTLKSDIDLDIIKNIAFYYKKITLISKSTYKHQTELKKDALRIKKIIEYEYPEYLL